MTKKSEILLHERKVTDFGKQEEALKDVFGNINVSIGASEMLAKGPDKNTKFVNIIFRLLRRG